MIGVLPATGATIASFLAYILEKKLAKNPRVFVKISEVLRRVEGKVPMDLVFYKPRLDYLWQVFGEDRVIFGSDWPNSDNWAEYPAVFGIVREYAMSKGRAAAEEYFWLNSVAAYRWVKRTREQPGIARQ